MGKGTLFLRLFELINKIQLMKSLIALSLLFILPTNAEEKNSFDNWLFKFFEGESEMFGDLLGPDGETYDQAAGKVVTTIDLKNKESVSSYAIRYKNLKTRQKSISTVKHLEGNQYSGTTKNQNNDVTTYTLTIVDDKRFRSTTKWPNNQTVTSEGVLKNKNTIEMIDTVRDANGAITLKVKFTYKRGKKPKK